MGPTFLEPSTYQLINLTTFYLYYNLTFATCLPLVSLESDQNRKLNLNLKGDEFSSSWLELGIFRAEADQWGSKRVEAEGGARLRAREGELAQLSIQKR